MYKYVLFSMTLILLCSGCEDMVVENDLSYTDKLVVRGIIEAGKPIQLFLGKTLPPNAPYDTLSAYIRDAVVMISTGTTTDTLRYTAGGVYRSAQLNGRNGSKYALKIQHGGKVVEAETEVPFTTTFQAGKLVLREEAPGDTSYYVEGVLTPRTGAVYGATWSIIDGQTSTVIEDTVLNTLVRERDKTQLGHLIIRTRNVPQQIIQQYRRSLYIRVHAFDEDFYNFFLTQDANNASSNIFSQAGTGLRWNVTGDGIGMFLGKSDFLIRIP